MYSVLLISLVLGNFFNPLEAVIEEYLNPTVSPCDDFYQYACGKWNEVSSNANTSDTLSFLDTIINGKVGTLLESENRQENQKVLEKVRTFYGSCRNLKTYDMGLFLNIVQPRSGWTVSSSWDETQFDWVQAVAELKRYGAKILLEQTIAPYYDNSSLNIICLDSAKFQPSTEEAVESVLRRASLNISLAEEFTLFEKQLGEIFPNPDACDYGFDLEEVTFASILKTMPGIKWQTYFSTIFGQELDLNTPMMVQNLDVMRKLALLLQTSPPKIVCNYIMIKFLQFIDEYSIDHNSPTECGRAVHQAMPLAVDHIIENHFYEHEYDEVVQDLLNYLKVEFLAEVSKLYKTQKDVLLYIYTKVSVMDVQIGNSDRNMTFEAVSKYYEGLGIKAADFYANLLEAFKFKVERELKWLRGEPTAIAYHWSVTPSPFFLQQRNRIVVPLTLLQDELFGEDTATNKYSVLGFIIGHELLHGFDWNGVHYDYNGSMVESSLGCNPSFRKQMECIDEVGGVKGVKGDGEKVADIGGIRLAYDAFQRSLIQNGKNIMDNAATATPRSLWQAFFIDFTQFFCGKPEKSLRLQSDYVHDSDELRVKRSIVNFDKFGSVFQCPPGSVMNPVKKCKVW